MSEPTSYGTFVIETNGHSFEEFTAHLEKVSIINSQPVSSEAVGTWKANLNSPIMVKDAASLANFSAVTVYKIVTVLVSVCRGNTVFDIFYIYVYRVRFLTIDSINSMPEPKSISSELFDQSES